MAKSKYDNEPSAMNLGEYVIIEIHKDNTAAVRTIKALANWDTVTRLTDEREAELRKSLDFIQKWKKLMRRPDIELIA